MQKFSKVHDVAWHRTCQAGTKTLASLTIFKLSAKAGPKFPLSRNHHNPSRTLASRQINVAVCTKHEVWPKCWRSSWMAQCYEILWRNSARVRDFASQLSMPEVMNFWSVSKYFHCFFARSLAARMSGALFGRRKSRFKTLFDFLYVRMHMPNNLHITATSPPNLCP